MSEKLGNKLGILTTEEGKFLAKIVADQIPVNGFWKIGLKLVLPPLLNGLDDKLGDKIPEPWQTYTEDLITALYEAFQDNIITDEELDLILQKCSEIINKEIDLPFLNEEDEAAAFLFLLKFIASTIKGALKKKQVSE